jgi:hypothetical protein
LLIYSLQNMHISLWGTGKIFQRVLKILTSHFEAWQRLVIYM